GEKDEAPMLYIGEQIGTGDPPQVDVAVDPIDGTTLLSKGLPNAISVVAMAAGRGSLYDAKHVHYMHKIATGAEAAGSLNIDDPVAVNLQRVARAKRMRVSNLTVVILDRPRHEALIKEVRDTGARIKLISDGDVAGAVMAAIDGTGQPLRHASPHLRAPPLGLQTARVVGPARRRLEQDFPSTACGGGSGGSPPAIDQVRPEAEKSAGDRRMDDDRGE